MRPAEFTAIEGIRVGNAESDLSVVGLARRQGDGAGSGRHGEKCGGPLRSEMSCGNQYC
jgi:hypothetical protein